MTTTISRLTYIRPSAASVWVKCSAAPAEVAALHRAAGSAGDPAREGQLGHAVCELLIAGHAADDINVAGLALEYGVEASEVGWLVFFAERAVRAYVNADATNETYATEQRMSLNIDPYPALTGTCDYLSWSQPDSEGRYELSVIDWKFGRNAVESAGTNWQLWCYVVMAAESFELGPVKRVRARVVYPRLNRADDEVTFEAEDIEAMRSSLVRSAKRCYAEQPEYRTGAHCADCNARDACPAVNKALSVFCGDLVATDGKPPKPFRDMSPTEAAQSLNMAQLVTRWAAEITAGAKSWVKHNGPLTLPNGKTFELICSQRHGIDLGTEAAWPLLESACGATGLLSGLSVSKTKVMAAAAKKYLAENNKTRFGRGEKLRLERELMDALWSEGAVVTKQTERYEYVKKDKRD